MPGQEERETSFFLLQPDPVLDGEELNGQVVPDVLHALAQGDVTLPSLLLHCTVVQRQPARVCQE